MVLKLHSFNTRSLALSQALPAGLTHPTLSLCWLSHAIFKYKPGSWANSVNHVYRYRSYFPSLIALIMEAVCTAETSVNFYKTTKRNIPEGNHLLPQNPSPFSTLPSKRPPYRMFHNSVSLFSTSHNRTLNVVLKIQHSWLVFGRSDVQISVQRPAVLTKVYCSFSRSLGQSTGIALNVPWQILSTSFPIYRLQSPCHST
jgi:hypothetical protein